MNWRGTTHFLHRFQCGSGEWKGAEIEEGEKLRFLRRRVDGTETVGVSLSDIFEVSKIADFAVKVGVKFDKTVRRWPGLRRHWEEFDREYEHAYEAVLDRMNLGAPREKVAGSLKNLREVVKRLNERVASLEKLDDYKLGALRGSMQRLSRAIRRAERRFSPRHRWVRSRWARPLLRRVFPSEIQRVEEVSVDNV